MSIETILAKLGLTDEEALEFVTHYNKKYFETCSFSISLSVNSEYEHDSKYTNISIDVSLEDQDGTTIFSSNESCSF